MSPHRDSDIGGVLEIPKFNGTGFRQTIAKQSGKIAANWARTCGDAQQKKPRLRGAQVHFTARAAEARLSTSFDGCERVARVPQKSL